MTTREVTQQYRLSQWAQRLHERQLSGLSITAWCEINGVSRNTYFYWQKRLRESACEELALRTGTAVTAAPTFAEVKMQIPESPGAVVVRLNGAEIEIKEGTSSELVENVLSALRKQC